ncbi:calcium/proton exchanger [Cladophialophora carrionii CBS 160.54]|uniref:Calcium/proton exchanger n=1 Tax=Cladophialophora carrionii CBS 160.54 TaxID=1279043 RepID=V9DMG1_9EURO|nr:calcium/proton exchanger [Cladophialophora carrionii CBS 160.54]ETI28050.1 calcium/proton exchanger [Cladophialophora carrionii CBS 160.54]
MHRVKAWAHTSAHKHNFNPWSPSHDNQPSDSGKRPSQDGEPEKKEKPKLSVLGRVLANVKVALFHSWVNVLLVFVPVGIAVHFAGLNDEVVFALNAVAIIPLAGLLTFATECVAHRLGPTLGALLNVSFGNAVELIIFIIALVKNQIRIVQASLIGSLLANLLLILGMAFLIGGLEYQEQIYDSTVTQMSACLLALAVLSLLIPTAFHASFSDLQKADTAVLKLSRGTSVILLIIYVLYLLFQLKSHAYLYQGTPQHIIDEEATPGILQRFDSSSSSSASSLGSSVSTGGSHRRVSKRIRAKLGRRRQIKTEVEEEADNKGSSAQPGPAVADFQAETTAEPEEINDHDRVTLQLPASSPKSAVRPGNESRQGMPTTPADASSKDRKLSMGPRGLSFRTPPVFRSSTNPYPTGRASDYPQSSLRHYSSAPHQQNQSAGAARITRPASTKSTQAEEEDAPPMSQTASIVLLLVSTGLVALCAEFLVGSIDSLVENSPLSEAFIGLIILPIVGNAAEHVTAVTVAAKNKLDLALGVSLGSSIQIALFVTPFVVILGWILDKNMSLYFSLFETGSLFVSTFIVNFLVLDGRSNYLEGALLCACYVIVAVGAYFFPDGQDQSSLTSGPGGG